MGVLLSVIPPRNTAKTTNQQNSMKDNLAIILERVNTREEVTVKLEKDISEPLFRKIEKRANEAGIDAYPWHNQILFRKTIAI